MIAVGDGPAASAEAASGLGWTLHTGQALRGDVARLDDSASVEPWDIQTIIFTSGTTGPSKGVLSPYLQLYTTAVVNYGYVPEGASVLVNLPMFHIGGTSPMYCALVRSGMFYLVDGFSTSHFWEQVRRGNCATTSGLIGVMAAFLMKSEPRAEDRDNPLQCLTMFPVNEATVAFSRRFGFDYLTGFNMTEVSTPLITDVNTDVYGCCGRPRSGIECRLVDAHDFEVAPGSVGELIVRSEQPWTMTRATTACPRPPRPHGATAGSTPATCSARTPAATTTSSTGSRTRSAGAARTSPRSRSRTPCGCTPTSTTSWPWGSRTRSRNRTCWWPCARSPAGRSSRAR
ncbi:MAG: AMP-binding protein [Steroidobacteraceae bacterium]